MYCAKCGTQLSDNCKFCSNCGMPTNPTFNQGMTNAQPSNVKLIKLDNNIIFRIVVSSLMILSMLFLPMGAIRGKDAYLLLQEGLNYSNDDVLLFSNVIFIFALVAVIAYLFFAITKKSIILSITSSFFILIMFITYDIGLFVIRQLDYSQNSFSIGIGSIICIFCAVFLLVLSFRSTRTNQHYVKIG